MSVNFYKQLSFDFGTSDDFKVYLRLRAVLYSLKSCNSHLDRVHDFMDSLLFKNSLSNEC